VLAASSVGSGVTLSSVGGDIPAITGTSKSKLVTGLGPWVGLDTAGTPLLAVDELTCRVFCSGGFLDCVRANPLRSEPRGGDGGG